MYLRRKGEKPLTFDQINMNFLCATFMLDLMWEGGDPAMVHPLDPDFTLTEAEFNKALTFDKPICNIKLDFGGKKDIKYSANPSSCDIYAISLSKGSVVSLYSQTLTSDYEYLVVVSYYQDNNVYKFNPNLKIDETSTQGGEDG